jgi:hypothetical protein
VFSEHNLCEHVLTDHGLIFVQTVSYYFKESVFSLCQTVFILYINISKMANCNVCLKNITTKQLKLACEDCKLPFHAGCVRMSKNDVETLSSEGLPWRCDTCATNRRRSMRLESQAEHGTLTLQDVMQAMNEMREEQKKMATEFNTSYEALNDKLEESVKSVRDQTTKVEEYLAKLESLTTENLALKSKVSELENRLDEAEQYSRRNCVEIFGVPHQVNENVVDVVKKVGSAVNMEITDSMIDTCQRLAKKNDSTDPPGIIVKFVRRLDKEELLQKKRGKPRLSTRHMGLHDDRAVYVNESLAPSRRRLFVQARKFKKDNNYRYVWHRNGKVFLRKEEGGPVKLITCQADLSK